MRMIFFIADCGTGVVTSPVKVAEFTRMIAGIYGRFAVWR
ncbi:hypothetical protein TIFTF001_044833 [Ficus carica]|uniref:Uncharacterized protein n=1 Tax=Ficus carica TaxID=3494 RepID=A0AA88CVS7_FICCA|nr:hypothetical protein TIFTF001_044833 [Ficus carica]